MKKKYVEPVMIVEDFTVSEMVAANCDVTETDIALVQQMGCYAGTEPVFRTYEEKQAYVLFSDLYEGKINYNGDKWITPDDSCFTAEYRNKSDGGTICCFDPYGENTTFGHNSGFECSSDSSVLQNS